MGKSLIESEDKINKGSHNGKSLVGVLGPSRNYCRKKVEYNSERLSDILVSCGYGAIINPMCGTAPETFGIIFKKHGGSPLVGVIYDDGRTVGEYDLLTKDTDFHNKDICDTLINCVSWREQPGILIGNSKHLIVLGLSTGVNWELSLPKFYWRLKLGGVAPNTGGRIFLLTELISDKYPARLNEGMRLEYISIEELPCMLGTRHDE